MEQQRQKWEKNVFWEVPDIIKPQLLDHDENRRQTALGWTGLFNSGIRRGKEKKILIFIDLCGLLPSVYLQWYLLLYSLLRVSQTLGCWGWSWDIWHSGLSTSVVRFTDLDVPPPLLLICMRLWLWSVLTHQSQAALTRTSILWQWRCRVSLHDLKPRHKLLGDSECVFWLVIHPET